MAFADVPSNECPAVCLKDAALTSPATLQYKIVESDLARWSVGRARGWKGNARALQTDDEGSEPKIGWILSPSPDRFLRPHPLD